MDDFLRAMLYSSKKVLNFKILGKRIAPIVLATAITTSGLEGIKNSYIKKEDEVKNGTSSASFENEFGHDDIDAFANTTIYPNDFVILHVENKLFQDISKLKAKIKKCNDLGISIGLVLDTKSDNLADFYKDLDFLQAIIKEFTIDLPIYCNIENIANNKSLNNAEKKALVEAFIEKANHSNLFLGLYGTDTTLYNFNKYVLDITDYNCFLVRDSEERKYTGPATIKQNLDGQITADENLAESIIAKGLNNASKLVYSSLYTVQENDTYESISFQSGLSVDDLKSYNKNLGNKLNSGDVIKIPNYYLAYNKDVNQMQYNYAIARGIDISSYQINFDWNRIKETSDFVITQVARDGSGYQNSCISQIQGTLSNDINLGLYFCINCDMNMENFKKLMSEYLENFNKDLNNAGITLNFANIPVFLDFEHYYEYNDYYGLMQIFEEKCRQLGCQNIGIYANRSTMENINANMEQMHNTSLKNTNWKIWLSGGTQYEDEKNHSGHKLEDLVEIPNEANKNAGFVPDIRQVTNVAVDTGASNGSGFCDVNYLYTQDIFGNPLPNQEDLIDVMEIDLSNYINISGYDVASFLLYAEGLVNKLSTEIVKYAIVGVTGYSIIVAVYNNQRRRRF